MIDEIFAGVMVYIINLFFFALLIVHGYSEEAYLTPDGRQALLMCGGMFVLNLIPLIWGAAVAWHKAR